MRYNKKVNLSTQLSQIKGVGPKTAEQLAQAGLLTVNDLIMFLPRKHDDFTAASSIATLTPGNVTITARCESISTRTVRRGLRITTAVLADSSGKLNAVWFNQPYRVQQLASGDECYFRGQFEYKNGRYQLTNPSAERVKELVHHDTNLLPIYHAVHSLKSQLVRKLLTELRPLITMLPETLPSHIVAREGLMSRSEALLAMHFPTTSEDVARARQRFAFEELFSLLLASQLNRQAHAQLQGYVIPFEQAIVRSFVSALPFTLTDDQRRAAWDILQDFQRRTPMNRLLQGDVGSGKTVVAGLAARQAASAGYQTALMAPTEILARQHAATLDALLTPFGIKVGLLTGSVTGATRSELMQRIARGEVDVVVGTHALIQDSVNFARLGFVVIDEQHRFGVTQRQKLLDKSGHMPHLLAMTATPIPRSLALTVYGELDISIISQRPAGRQPIITKIISPASRPALYQRVAKELEAGSQAYVVCSLIDDNPDNDARSVETTVRHLKSSILGRWRIGLLHGKMKPTDKERVMQEFHQHVYDILVSTTVVEVGVDVPNATVMMIEDAERFGLAQLHQLRGRVGRGARQSYCYLLLNNHSRPSQRLREVEASSDGFHLAEVDMQLRGPGEIYGKAQHGALNLRIASLADSKAIARAQKAAQTFIASGDSLEHYPELQAAVQRNQRLTTLN